MHYNILIGNLYVAFLTTKLLIYYVTTKGIGIKLSKIEFDYTYIFRKAKCFNFSFGIYYFFI